MVDVEDDHLGGAAGLAAGLDDASEGVESAHEGEWTGGGAAAGEGFVRTADGRQIGPCTRAPFEEHALSLGEGQDGVEGVLDCVDEAGRALRLTVAGDGEFDGTGVLVPVPVLGVGIWLEAVAADVEPDGRVEGGLLGDEEVDKLVVEDGCVFGRGEVAAVEAPVADGFCNAADEMADAGLALGGADLAVEVFAGDDVGRGHGPVDGDLDILLLEDGLAASVGDGGGAGLPLELVVGRDSGAGEEAREAQGCGGGLEMAGVMNRRSGGGRRGIGQGSGFPGRVGHGVPL